MTHPGGTTMLDRSHGFGDEPSVTVPGRDYATTRQSRMTPTRIVVDPYLSSLRRRGAPKSTMKTYGWIFSTLPPALRVDSLQDWADSWEHLSPSSRQQRLSAVSAMCKWGVRQNLLGADPTARWDRPRRPKRLPRPAPDSFIEELWELPDERVRLICLLAAYGGLRRAEIAALRWSDVDIPNRVMHVTGKGGKPRPVPIHRDLVALLAARRQSRGPVIASRSTGHPLCPESIGRIVSPYLQGLGLHPLRHWTGTRGYSETRDVFAVQQLLGHESPVTTSGYVLIEGRQVRAVVDSLPRRDAAAA